MWVGAWKCGAVSLSRRGRQLCRVVGGSWVGLNVQTEQSEKTISVFSTGYFVSMLVTMVICNQ